MMTGNFKITALHTHAHTDAHHYQQPGADPGKKKFGGGLMPKFLQVKDALALPVHHC